MSANASSHAKGAKASTRRKSGVEFAPIRSGGDGEIAGTSGLSTSGSVNPMAAMRGSPSASTTGFGRAQGLRGLRKDQKSSMASRRAAVKASQPATTPVEQG